MMEEERIKKIEEAFFKLMDDAAEKYPDIKMLLDDYRKLTTQKNWSEDFLKGYLSCISDLTIIKKYK